MLFNTNENKGRSAPMKFLNTGLDTLTANGFFNVWKEAERKQNYKQMIVNMKEPIVEWLTLTLLSSLNTLWLKFRLWHR